MPGSWKTRPAAGSPVAGQAWVTQQMLTDPNAQAARDRQSEVESELLAQRRTIEQRMLALKLFQSALAHQDAVLGFFSVPPAPKTP